MTTAVLPSPTAPAAPRRSQGARVIRWIEGNCRHTNGEWIGKPFRFLPWEKRLVYELFEIGADDYRRYWWALVGLPKKSGKTELAAAISLYLLMGDGEPAPLVVCAAANEEQADLVYGAAKTMCELSPTLSKVTELYEREILVPSIPGARLKRLAATAGTNDGQNIHAAVLDELHEWAGPKGEQVWNVLTNATGARRQPMILQITTAGYDVDGTICGKQYQYGKRVRSGEVDDPRYYFHWVEAPAGADYRDPEVWRAANPSYGTLVHEDFFRDQLTKKTEAVFRRYFLNQFTQTEEIWLPAGAWDACLNSNLDLDPGLPVHVGIDVGIKHDSSGVVLAQKQGEQTVLRAKVWENPYPPDHPLYEDWRLSIAEVENYLREVREQFPVPACEIDGAIQPGPEFAYDPHFFERSAQLLRGDSLAMVEFPQSDQRMIPASQTFYDLIVSGQIAHNGDKVLARHVNNVTADQKPRGWRMSKPKGSGRMGRRIDAAIAAAMAVHRAQQPAPQVQQSVYEERGVRTI